MHRRLSVFVLSVLVPAAVQSGAQTKRAMTLVDMLEVPQLTDPRLSPDGRHVAFVLAKADWKANKRVSHVWRIGTDGAGLVQMTSGARGETSPRWAPDGSQIAFIAARASGSASQESAEEISQIFIIQNSGGEAEPLARHETSVSQIAWAPDGSAIYFLASDPKSAEEKERDKAKDDVYAYDENFKQTHLWKVALAEKKEQRLTEGDYSILSYQLSRDGSKIALHRGPTPLPGDTDQGEVWVMSSSGGGAVQLTRNRVPESHASLSPDNSQVLFTSGSNSRFETYYNSNLFLVSASGGDARLVLPDFPYGVDDAAWSGDGKSITMVCNMGVHSELFELDPATRKYRQITGGAHAIAGWRPTLETDSHVFLVNQSDNPGEIHLLKAGEREPARVTRIFEYLARDFRLPRQEKIEWRGADGVAIEGVLTYPLDYQSGTKSPLVVQTHGGPQSSDKLTFSSWSLYRPVLAAKGYAVLQPNYRGSTGYGNAFLRDMVGHYFNQAHLDVMAGADELVRRGIADPERMVKMGWSAGGHMTNKIITFTDRFKAASSGAGAANWISMYGTSDVRTYRTPWFGGTPWQKEAPIQVYWDNSPLKDVAKVKTPTLFLVGEKDVRVPMTQSVEMYRALKSGGIPTHLYIAPREPHGWTELRHELFKLNVELDWFERHATKRTYTWEKPPSDKEADAKRPPSSD